jgi:hypothetical protein
VVLIRRARPGFRNHGKSLATGTDTEWITCGGDSRVEARHGYQPERGFSCCDRPIRIWEHVPIDPRCEWRKRTAVAGASVCVACGRRDGDRCRCPASRCPQANLECEFMSCRSRQAVAGARVDHRRLDDHAAPGSERAQANRRSQWAFSVASWFSRRPGPATRVGRSLRCVACAAAKPVESDCPRAAPPLGVQAVRRTPAVAGSAGVAGVTVPVAEDTRGPRGSRALPRSARMRAGPRAAM